MNDAFKGALVGLVLGAFGGLGLCIWVFTEDLLFPGDTILIGGLFGGLAGFIWGDDFFEWLKDHWWKL